MVLLPLLQQNEVREWWGNLTERWWKHCSSHQLELPAPQVIFLLTIVRLLLG